MFSHISSGEQINEQIEVKSKTQACTTYKTHIVIFDGEKWKYYEPINAISEHHCPSINLFTTKQIKEKHELLVIYECKLHRKLQYQF